MSEKSGLGLTVRSLVRRMHRATRLNYNREHKNNCHDLWIASEAFSFPASYCVSAVPVWRGEEGMWKTGKNLRDKWSNVIDQSMSQMWWTAVTGRYDAKPRPLASWSLDIETAQWVLQSHHFHHIHRGSKLSSVISLKLLFLEPMIREASDAKLPLLQQIQCRPRTV